MYKKIYSHFIYAFKKRITTIAGAWVYFFLSALLPITFLLITAYSIFGVDISSEIVQRVPTQFRDILLKLLLTAKSASKGLTIFFGVSVIFSGSALIRQMLLDGSYIYDYSKKNNVIFRVIKGIIAVCVLFFIFIFSALLLIFGKILLNRVIGGKINFLFVFIGSSVFVGLCYLVIFLLNVVICPFKIKKRIVLLSSLISLMLIYLSTLFLRIYLSISSTFNTFYGGLASIFGVLLWIYTCMLSLTEGVIINAYILENFPDKF